MKHGTSKVSRRRFMTVASAAGAAVAIPALIPGSALGMNGAVAPSERIVMGGIGVGRRGQHDLSHILAEPDAQFIANCDVQASRAATIKQMVDTAYGNSDLKLYRDMFEILQRDDIDAFLIATGDRWHTMASIIAARHGKDIYCEKPCSMTIAESRALADGINRYGVVYQAGTQRRNVPNFQFAAELALSGKLGKVHTVHANTLKPGTSHDWLPAEPEPAKEVCDWDRWLGPSPWRPYNSRYINGGWRGFHDFHGGGLLEWGSHTVDLCQWAAGADGTCPVEYIPVGNHVHATYADGKKLIMRDTGWLGLGTCSVRYEGDEGWVETGDSGHIMVSPESLRGNKKVIVQRGTDSKRHMREFLNCVKTRGMTASNADAAAQAHIACHAAYIATQLGRKVEFDPVEKVFLNDEEANRMRTRAMREPWRV